MKQEAIARRAAKDITKGYDIKVRIEMAIEQALAQRTWVGLAAEDRLTAKYMQDAPDGIEAVIDYIEAKLKEKNT